MFEWGGRIFIFLHLDVPLPKWKMKVNQSRFLAKYVILVVTGILGEHLNIYIYIIYVYTKINQQVTADLLVPTRLDKIMSFLLSPQDSE